ncbi:MAG: hypothetical protein MR346_09350 [Clostridium sp.]|nr:hypothetical protein [Clostridium sp.]
MRKDLMILTRGKFMVGAFVNMDKATAQKIKAVEKDDSLSSILTAVKAVTTAINGIDVDALDNVVRVHVPSNVYDVIVSGRYKFYCLTGKDGKGNIIPDHEMSIWQDFADAMQSKGMFFTFRNIKNCFIPEQKRNNARVMRAINRSNKALVTLDAYANNLKDAMDKLCPRPDDDGIDYGKVNYVND